MTGRALEGLELQIEQLQAENARLLEAIHAAIADCELRDHFEVKCVQKILEKVLV